MQRQKFINWLNQELDKRGMKPADLAERGGISASTVSRIRSGEISLSIEACQGIAKGLGIPVDVVLIGAGVLPVANEASQEEKEIVGIVQSLTRPYRLFLLQMLRGVSNQYQPQQAEPAQPDSEFHVMDILDLMIKLNEVPPEHIRQAIIYLEHKGDTSSVPES